MNYEKFKSVMKSIELLDLDTVQGKEDNYFLYQKYLLGMTTKQYTRYLQKYLDETREKRLFYMYTFTLKEGADREKAHQYILSIRNRQENLNLTDLAYVIENMDTNKHYHVLMGSTRNIRADAFKQYSQKYGFIKRSRKVGQTDVQIVDYMSKHETIVYLIKDKKVLPA